MEEAENKIKLKVIYWVIALAPLVFLNLLPYLGISYPETIDSDETFNKLVLGFSVIFTFFLIGIFASYKCIVYSEIMPTKIMASLILLLYLILDLVMIYIFMNAYYGG